MRFEHWIVLYSPLGRNGLKYQKIVQIVLKMPISQNGVV